MIARYCIDGAFLGALERMRTQTETGLATITDTWLSYILTTGANWRSPIRDFRLVVDKGRRAQSGQLLWARGAADQPDPVRDAPPQLAADAGSARPYPDAAPFRRVTIRSRG